MLPTLFILSHLIAAFGYRDSRPSRHLMRSAPKAEKNHKRRQPCISWAISKPPNISDRFPLPGIHQLPIIIARTIKPKIMTIMLAMCRFNIGLFTSNTPLNWYCAVVVSSLARRANKRFASNRQTSPSTHRSRLAQNFGDNIIFLRRANTTYLPRHSCYRRDL